MRIKELESNERIFFLRDKNQFPVACIASLLMEGGVQFAISVCNPLDEYDRHAARSIALKRLRTGSIAGSVDSGQGVKQRILQALKTGKVALHGMEAKNQVPLSSRVRKAAQYRIKKYQDQQKAKLT